MTVTDYIRGKLGGFGIQVSEADMLEVSLSAGIGVGDEVSQGNIGLVSVGLARLIPSLLLRPASKSVSENGHSKSMSWDTAGVRAYYAYLCRRYGLEDTLDTDKPKIRAI